MPPSPPWVFVKGVREAVPPEAVLRMLGGLPAGAVGEFDEEVGAVVVKVYGDAGRANEVLRVLAELGLVLGGPGSEQAVIKHLPVEASRPASWEVLEDGSAICTTCSWVTPPGMPVLEQEMRRHADRVHRGAAI